LGRQPRVLADLPPREAQAVRDGGEMLAASRRRRVQRGPAAGLLHHEPRLQNTTTL